MKLIQNIYTIMPIYIMYDTMVNMVLDYSIGYSTDLFSLIYLIYLALFTKKNKR